jgi:predicted DNA-binding transcriptional regulator AlpA
MTKTEIMRTEIDRVIWRPDLCKMSGVTSECIRIWIKSGKLPQPDVFFSKRTMGWRLSTLQKAGVGLL